MQGLELVSDRTKKTPAGEETVSAMEYCMNNGLLVGKGGLFGNVIRIQPPIALSPEQIEKGMTVLGEALASVEK